NFLKSNPKINIVYSNAISIDYEGHELTEFTSIYKGEKKQKSTLLKATELLSGNQTKYFLNILTPVLRTTALLDIFKESWRFESEEYLCYYIASVEKEIGFIYDKTVALREAEHHRTAFEDGKIVDWKKRKDIRIRQIFNIYNTLVTLHPETLERLETPRVHNFLAKHMISQAKVSKSIKLVVQTVLCCYLFFRKFNLREAMKLKNDIKKSFG
ncbi:hypothetical protein ACOHYD_13190, partial [Desulfobacterota bacterium M19]